MQETMLACHNLPVRIMWYRASFCPELHETDGVQTVTNDLLDAADAASDDSLPLAGYSLLAINSCPSLQHPSNRAALTSYAQSRGLTLVFSDPTSEALRPRAIERSIFPRDEASACLSRALADSAGAAGWNDPRGFLAIDEAAGRGAAARSSPRSLDEKLRALRMRFAQACMHRRPLVLSPFPLSRIASAGALAMPGSREAQQWVAESHRRVVSVVTDRLALALHASPFNTSLAAALAYRHPLRIAAGVEGVQAWVRHLPRLQPHRHQLASPVPPQPVSSLLLVNTNEQPVTVSLPADAPWLQKGLYAVSAWGGGRAPNETWAAHATAVRKPSSSGLAAWSSWPSSGGGGSGGGRGGGRDGGGRARGSRVPMGVPLTSVWSAIDVAPRDVVLLLLFASEGDAHAFAEGSADVRTAVAAIARRSGGGGGTGGGGGGTGGAAAAATSSSSSSSSSSRDSTQLPSLSAVAGGLDGDTSVVRAALRGSGGGSPGPLASLAMLAGAAALLAAGWLLLQRRRRDKQSASTFGNCEMSPQAMLSSPSALQAIGWRRHGGLRGGDESPIEGSGGGTESKRKGRGKSRPPLPSAWTQPHVPQLPNELHKPIPCALHSSANAPSVARAPGADPPLVSSRRGFAYNPSWTDISQAGLERQQQPRRSSRRPSHEKWDEKPTTERDVITERPADDSYHDGMSSSDGAEVAVPGYGYAFHRRRPPRSCRPSATADTRLLPDAAPPPELPPPEPRPLSPAP